MTVQESLNSILNQSYQNWELLISDNCSTDGTFEIIRRLVANDSRVRLVRQVENLGGWPNFNYVFNASKGRFFKFHAGDDYLSSDYLVSIVRNIQLSPNMAGYCTPDNWDTLTENRNDFDFLGSQSDRLGSLRRLCWKSNGVFYGVFHREILNRAMTPDLYKSKIYILDWLILARILKEGEIVRTKFGLLTLGSNGASNSNPLTWFNQLNGLVQKAMPYLGFVSLFNKGGVFVSLESRIVICKWVLEMNLIHYKGLLRLAVDRAGIKRLPT